VNVCKVYVDGVLNFISGNLGEISLFSYQQKCRIAQSHARCAQAG
jgi:hypothetical protein